MTRFKLPDLLRKRKGAPVSGRPIPFWAALRRDREPRPAGKESPSHDKSEYASVRLAGFDSEKHHWCTPLPRIRSLIV